VTAYINQGKTLSNPLVILNREARLNNKNNNNKNEMNQLI